MSKEQTDNKEQKLETVAIAKLKTHKKLIAWLLIILWSGSILIRLTPLIQYYWINFISAFVVKNTVWILLIACLLFGLSTLERLLFEKKAEEERRNINERSR